MEELLGRIKPNMVRVVLVILGLGSIGIGILNWSQTDSQNEVEIIEEAGIGGGPVVVDVAGAVKHPGVYQLEAGGRVGQALEKAGGLSDNADTGWIEKMVNLAESVKDGQKIFIPSENESNTVESAVKGTSETVSTSSLVNINTATKQELEGLWGIGEARAQAIIENRPYGSLDELKTKAKITESIIEKNQGKISVY